MPTFLRILIVFVLVQCFDLFCQIFWKFPEIWIETLSVEKEKCAKKTGIFAEESVRPYIEFEKFLIFAFLSVCMSRDRGNFLRNSRKYGLGCIRKNPTEDIFPTGSSPTRGEFALILKPNPTQPISRLKKKII